MGITDLTNFRISGVLGEHVSIMIGDKPRRYVANPTAFLGVFGGSRLEKPAANEENLNAEV